MKKLFTLFAAALVMLAAASCEKNEVLPGGNVEGKVITLKASINNGETKTSLGASVAVPESDPVKYTYPVLWSEGDAIAVIQGDVVYKFNLNSVDNTGQSGTFALDNTLNYQKEFDEDGEIKAFYPYSGVSLESGKIKYNVPATQIYAENSFGNGASPMAAYRAAEVTDALDFVNLFGVLKLQFKGAETIKSIVVTSDKKFNGASTVSIGSDGVAIDFVSEEVENDKKVTLTCGDNGVALDSETATEFLIALPQSLNSEIYSLQIIINSTAGETSKVCNLNTQQAIQAGSIKKMPVIDFNISYIENGVYLGDGVAIPCTIEGETKTLIWAPFNCGYHVTNYPKGKYYQWGRKDGQSYGTSKRSSVTYTSDLIPDPETYYNNWRFSGEWTGDNNPCPDGWRIPTKEELSALRANYKKYSYTPRRGMWFSGANEYSDGMLNAIFLDAAGCNIGYGTGCQSDNNVGYYWTSSINGDENYVLEFSATTSSSTLGVFTYRTNGSSNGRSGGNTIRCVK